MFPKSFSLLGEKSRPCYCSMYLSEEPGIVTFSSRVNFESVLSICAESTLLKPMVIVLIHYERWEEVGGSSFPRDTGI